MKSSTSTLLDDDKPTTDEPSDAAARAERADQVGGVDEAETGDARDGADSRDQDQAVGTDAADRDSADGGRPRRRWARFTVLVVAVVIAIAMLGGFGFGGWLLYQQHQRDLASHQALEAAEKYATVLTSVDTNAIDQNFSDILDGSTGEFKGMYAKSSAQLRQLLIDNRAAAHGTVIEGAVQSATPNQVTVLLFVDQSVTNVAVPEPRIDRSRIKMTMDKVDGRWLASRIELP